MRPWLMLLWRRAWDMAVVLPSANGSILEQMKKKRDELDEKRCFCRKKTHKLTRKRKRTPTRFFLDILIFRFQPWGFGSGNMKEQQHTYIDIYCIYIYISVYVHVIYGNMQCLSSAYQFVTLELETFVDCWQLNESTPQNLVKVAWSWGFRFLNFLPRGLGCRSNPTKKGCGFRVLLR